MNLRSIVLSTFRENQPVKELRTLAAATVAAPERVMCKTGRAAELRNVEMSCFRLTTFGVNFLELLEDGPL